MTEVLTTPRLILRRMTLDDAPFILGLLNQPSFLRFIGDKGVRTEEDARTYIRTGPMQSYEINGYGLYLVGLRDSGEMAGMCGLVRREWLDHPDIGFSLLPDYWSKGYAREAAEAVLEEARDRHGLRRILAITNPDNGPSLALLEKLGFQHLRRVINPAGEELSLLGVDLSKRQEPVRSARPV